MAEGPNGKHRGGFASTPTGAMIHSVGRVGEVYTSSPSKRAREDRRGILEQDQVQVLRDVARGEGESALSLNLEEMLWSLGRQTDPCALVGLENVVAKKNDEAVKFLVWRKSVLRCRAALRLMRERGEHAPASVLMVAHGYVDPLTLQFPELSAMGSELANLVRYTDIVEQKRREMARTEASASNRFDEPVDLNMHRERLARADRCISSSDALRAALATFHEPFPDREGESIAEHETRKAGHRARRDGHKARSAAFLLEAKIQARRMLEDAERAYQRAWLERLL